MATDSSYPVQFFHRGGGGDGQWCSLGAAYAAVRVLRPQGHSLVMYSGPDKQPHQSQRIVFAYPILAGDAFERLDGSTLSWAEQGSGDEFALCFLDEASCAAVCGAISPVTTALAALDGIADRLEGLRVAAAEVGASAAGGDIACRLAQLSLAPGP
ncbi:hypothetical protein D1007_05904 [Hordeum vulgare]|uniref:Predicted protein n=1 Tax=Hordeum vulgare subsp. vulgare TaxID=112509 RepID=F2EDF9_HORVV|nr:uncharacterized protein LOC123446242 [Hordeum vulgare subsp. vulgare]KAE8816568.1 hypothetical protein D1007_05904 [Hordeum vulgare]KAI4997130.1 hypothetical protein ZWY2020_052472 [Hordeum vulgare]BAK05381.1 predicted protein [Hordeum vulgare subsp. vulgare]